MEALAFLLAKELFKISITSSSASYFLNDEKISFKQKNQLIG